MIVTDLDTEERSHSKARIRHTGLHKQKTRLHGGSRAPTAGKAETAAGGGEHESFTNSLFLDSDSNITVS